ncbi:hypothetical protein C8F04DRAFT_1068754 [Mycena alexandri]|uniref:Uncharacterized protein n=1 Tax=Mycena alexandri TaxID=1745969 RepID=A0AAD6TF81_9AGAR|nr:hypothetical protein C8F04DRAFT_1068754 [Mycena alexandri]
MSPGCYITSWKLVLCMFRTAALSFLLATKIYLRGSAVISPDSPGIHQTALNSARHDQNATQYLCPCDAVLIRTVWL